MRSSFPRSSTKMLDSDTKENTQNRNVIPKALALVTKHTHIPDFEGNKEKEVKEEEKEEGNNVPSTAREIYMNFLATKHSGKKMELRTSDECNIIIHHGIEPEGEFSNEKIIAHVMMWIDGEPAKTILENAVSWSGKSSNKGFVIDETSSGNGKENIYKSRKWKRPVADMSNRKPLSNITMVDKNQRVYSDLRVRLRDEEEILDEPEHPENKKGVQDVGGGGYRDRGTGEAAESLVALAAEEGHGMVAGKDGDEMGQRVS
ncbi:hypothetical protein ACH5RR_003635 [Cinchona calisaya]|uniref:Uncharacterized protein n=1 Tax=Cinchona calisaya TaxID=153742 RepID=A0ABD3AW12_9GENT